MVRSIRHGTSELIHFELLLQDVRTSTPSRYDVENYDQEIETFNSRRILYLQGDNGWLTTRLAYDISNPIVAVFTDLDGKMVPLEVIERMKAVEGDGVDWDQRGVEVGEAAWKVVTDWSKGVSV